MLTFRNHWGPQSYEIAVPFSVFPNYRFGSIWSNLDDLSIPTDGNRKPCSEGSTNRIATRRLGAGDKFLFLFIKFGFYDIVFEHDCYYSILLLPIAIFPYHFLGRV